MQDMTQLNHLHEAGVLWNLKKRYSNDDIYTYTGNILIAVNPFQVCAKHCCSLLPQWPHGRMASAWAGTLETLRRPTVVCGVGMSNA